jgi:hypothetical protein
MIYTALVLFGLLFSQTVLALTQVSATVDKNPVMEKESFVLQVTADDDVDSNALDTSPLLQDFIVGRTSVSSQTSMVNFNTTRITKWTTVLIARKAGNVTIPALTVDSFKTTPIAIEVLKSTDKNGSAQQNIFITSEVSSKEVYVQQQLTLTVKLHFAAELKRGSLTEPSLDNANITQIGKDKENDTIINGKRYRVIERNYAINPQQSGEFILKTPLFSGEILAQNNRRTNFLSFAETKPVSVLGEEITLTVKPIPDDYQGFWLPSEILTLHQEWQPDASEFKVGDPITRTITLTAAGLSEEQLPDITVDMPKGIKVYPDQAELHTGMNSNKLVSQKKQNFALVASKAGTYELPEIIVPWWNTITNKLQKAVIPAKTITILPNDEMEAPTPPTPVTADVDDLQSPPTKTIIIKESSWLQWLFLSLWLLTSLAWIISTIVRKRATVQPTTLSNENVNSYSNLLNACKNNHGDKVLMLIIPWTQQLYPTQKVSTLDDVKRVINNSDFTHALTELQQSFYGKTTAVWNGDALLKILQSINNNPKSSKQKGISLNP